MERGGRERERGKQGDEWTGAVTGGIGRSALVVSPGGEEVAKSRWCSTILKHNHGLPSQQSLRHPWHIQQLETNTLDIPSIRIQRI